MSELPAPPKNYEAFSQRYPKLAEAWGLLAQAGAEGPLDERTARLVKLAVAIGAGHVGAVHASVRKASSLGIARDEIEQVVALAASTVGLPAAAAAHSWVQELLDD